MEVIEPLDRTRTALDQSWQEIGRVGTWWTGAERLSMATEARSARGCALCAERKNAPSPYSVEDQHTAEGGLAAPIVDAVHRLSTDPGRVTERWFDDLIEQGIEPEAVVELVGIVSTVALADTLAIATGDSERVLPEGIAGMPSRVRPPGLETDCAWVPTVDPERAEGTIKLVYDMVAGDAGFVFHVARALTSVPETMQTFFRAFSPNYRTHGPTAGALSRPQVEVLASSTSAINECFY